MRSKTIRIIDNICLFLMIFLGSMVTYFAMNLFLSDVANYENSFNWPYVLATFPMLMLSLAFVTFAIFFARFLGYSKEYRMHLVRHYAIILAAYNVIGIITTILSAAIAYKSFLTPCPFPGSLIVYLIIHTLLLIAHITLIILITKKLTPADKKVKITVKYALYTTFISVFTFIAFDRAGAGFISPMYIEWRELNITWFFYLSLFVPMIVLIVLILYKLKHLKLDNYLQRTIIWGILSFACLSLCLATVISSLNNQLVVSLISPAMPLERLATIPVDFIFLYAPVVIITMTEFIISLVKLIKNH